MKTTRSVLWATALITGLTLSLMTVPSQAAMMGLEVFLDPDLWESTAGPVAVEDFNRSDLGALASGSNPFNGFDIVIGVNCSPKIENNNRVRDPNEPFFDFVTPGDTIYVSLEYDESDDVSVEKLVFDQPTTAFSANWASTVGFAGNLTMTPTNADGSGPTIRFEDNFAGYPGDGFLGFVSDTPFTELFFGISSTMADYEFFGMDDAAYAVLPSEFAIPEPGTLLLYGVGLIGLARATRRRIG
jgi:hypothetical protein